MNETPQPRRILFLLLATLVPGLAAGIGAGAGTGAALLRKGKNVRIKSDEEFEIRLEKEVVLPVLDY